MKWIGKHIVTSDATFIDDINLGDGDKIILGDGSDAEIYVSGDDLYIVNTTDDKDIIFQTDNSYGDTTTYIQLDGSELRTHFYQQVRVADSKQFAIGNGDDLELKHDGSNSTILNHTGNLTISQRADDADIILESDDGSGGVTA